MLINLSNHPFEKWDEKHQQAAFREFGIVEDFDFPEVNPNADTDEVTRLAAEYLLACITKLETTDGKKDAIHISGEPCFLFQFVTLAKAQGISCVCSTTPRLVTNEGNTKISNFHFYQFRKYYLV
jgi:hypothetical protein